MFLARDHVRVRAVDFIFEPPRILPIDRITDKLGAFGYCPAHLSLGKEHGQPESLPVFYETAVASEDRRDNAIADLYGAFPVKWLFFVWWMFLLCSQAGHHTWTTLSTR